MNARTVHPRLGPLQFLRGLPARVRTRVPGSYASFRSSTEFSLVHLWFGNPALHYEVWLRNRAETIEIGLHFEADALTNARLLGAFRARERAIHRVLGPEVRIESWDKGWARVWEPLSFDTLDVSVLERVATRLAVYMNALEPTLRAELPSDVVWNEPRTRAERAQRAGAPVRAKQRR